MADSDATQQILEAFRRFDENKDGNISRSELTNVLRILGPDSYDDDTISALLKEVDMNKDGKIQYEEFVKWVMAENTGAPASPKCAMEKHGNIDINYRVFLPDRFQIDITQRFDLDKLQLGEGGYGKVYIARDKNFADRLVAVKKVTRSRDADRSEALDREIESMKELDHPNICKLLATYMDRKTMYFVMELCEGGEVFDRIIKQGFISQKMTAEIVAQVTEALNYAHCRGIAHRDIKPENVVFCSNDPKDTRVKLIDWGLAMSFLGCPMKAAVGSFTYAAPEVISSRNVREYTEACDLWSLGVLTYVMLCGRPPFWGEPQQHLAAARAERYPLKGGPWEKMNPLALNFVKSLLKAKPDDRMPIGQAVKHAWFQEARSAEQVTEDESKDVMTNLTRFSNASTFTRMCVTAVARQMDHTDLKDIHRVFRELDANGDGVLSYEEITNGFAKMFGAESEEYKNIAHAFNNLDLDGSKSIDYTEFCAAGMGHKASEQEDVMYAAFQAFDVDNSGYLCRSDLKKILDTADVRDVWSSSVCEDLGQQIVGQLDSDGDGKLSYEDWKSIMEKCWREHQPKSQNDEKSRGSIVNPYDILAQVSRLPDAQEAGAARAGGNE